MKNFVYRDRFIQKRNGYEQLYQVKQFRYLAKPFSNTSYYNEIKTNGTEIHNVWCFVAEDGKEHLVAHVGKLLFEITDYDNQKIEFTPITQGIGTGYDNQEYNLCYEFLDKKTQAFVGGNKLWFLGGNKYMCLRFLKENENVSNTQLFAVEDNDDLTPIPTTTISITYENSLVNGRHSLDRVNLLTMWRKNKLISGTTKNEDSKTKTDNFTYTLDSPLVCKNIAEDMANFSIEIEEGGTIE